MSQHTDDLGAKTWNVGGTVGVGVAAIDGLGCEVVDRLLEGARDHGEDLGAQVLDVARRSVTHYDD